MPAQDFAAWSQRAADLQTRRDGVRARIAGERDPWARQRQDERLHAVGMELAALQRQRASATPMRWGGRPPAPRDTCGMQLQEILFSQGFGTRRICAGLVQQGHVSIGGERVTDASLELDPRGLSFSVDGVGWEYHEKAYLMLHKPAGTECSRKPSAYPSIYTLLPAPLRQRPQKGGTDGVQAVGRLDQDTTGLLLLSDDGQFIHRMNSPRHHVPKTYEVTTRHPVEQGQVARLRDGVVLDDDPKPVRAAACEITGERSLRLTLTEGKYHQVKRMIASVGNRVEALHRSRVGELELPPDLAPGHWRWLGAAELERLRG